VSLTRREALIQEIESGSPTPKPLLRSTTNDMSSSSWDMLAYSYERAFEALWDQTLLDTSGLLLRPLLLLWRHSIELSLKAAVIETSGHDAAVTGHHLEARFDQLLASRSQIGFSNADELIAKTRKMLAEIDDFDRGGSRFRYPRDTSGVWFEGVDADLDDLFRAHWIITLVCDGAAIEAEQMKGIY